MNRGDVYRIKMPKGTGQKQAGERYAVIVQADEFLPRSAVIVAPTSRRARPASFRPEITVRGETTRVLVEQVGAVDVSRLGRRTGSLGVRESWAVDEALATVLGLN